MPDDHDVDRDCEPNSDVMKAVRIDDFQFVDTVFGKLVVEILVQLPNAEPAEV